MKGRPISTSFLSIAPVFLFCLACRATTDLWDFDVRINRAADRIASSVNSAQRFSLVNDTLNCYLYQEDYRLVTRYIADAGTRDTSRDPHVEAISLYPPNPQHDPAQQHKDDPVIVFQFTDNNGNTLPCRRTAEQSVAAQAKKRVWVKICKGDQKRPRGAGALALMRLPGVSRDPRSGGLLLNGCPMVINAQDDSAQQAKAPATNAVPAPAPTPAAPQMSVSAWSAPTSMFAKQPVVDLSNLTAASPPQDNSGSTAPPQQPVADFKVPSTSSQSSTQSSNLFSSANSSKMYLPNEVPPLHSFRTNR